MKGFTLLMTSLSICTFLFCGMSCKSSKDLHNVYQEHPMKKYKAKIDLSYLHDWNQIKIVDRAIEGQLDLNDLNTLWEFVGFEDSSKYIVISYLHGQKECGGMWTARNYNKQERKTEKLLPAALHQWVYLHSGSAELERYQEVRPYKYDVDEKVNKMFLNGHVHCSSYILVRKDGAFVGWVGELSIEHDLPPMAHYLLSKI